jgi:hypothetical protein
MGSLSATGSQQFCRQVDGVYGITDDHPLISESRALQTEKPLWLLEQDRLVSAACAVNKRGAAVGEGVSRSGMNSCAALSTD